jgi:hypothetical protein
MVVFKFHRAKGCLIQDCECPAFQEGRLLGANEGNWAGVVR